MLLWKNGKMSHERNFERNRLPNFYVRIERMFITGDCEQKSLPESIGLWGTVVVSSFFFIGKSNLANSKSSRKPVSVFFCENLKVDPPSRLRTKHYRYFVTKSQGKIIKKKRAVYFCALRPGVLRFLFLKFGTTSPTRRKLCLSAGWQNWKIVLAGPHLRWR